MKDIRKDALLVVVVAPTVYDIVANSFEQGTIRIALKFFDVRKSEFHSSTSSKSSKSI